MIPEERQKPLFFVGRDRVERLSEGVGSGIDRIGNDLTHFGKGFCGK